MPQVVLVIAIIAIVAQTALSVKAAGDAKDAARKDADARQRRITIQEQQRNLEKQRREAALRRSARQRRSSIINTAFAQGARFTTSFAGASQAVLTGANREGTFLNQSNALAQSADDITREQIQLNKETQIQNATNQQIGAVIEGVGSIASAVGGSFGGAGGGGGGGSALNFQGSGPGGGRAA